MGESSQVLTNENQQEGASGQSGIGGGSGGGGAGELLRVVRGRFEGYKGEAAEALGAACLGLGRPFWLRSHIAGQGVRQGAGAGGMLRPPRGLILHGPPGTGKTTLMRAMAGALANLGCGVVELSVGLLLSRYEGEAETQLRELFRTAAERAPCLLLADDLHLLAAPRSGPGTSELQKRVVSCLLTLLDGVGEDNAGAGAGACAGMGLGIGGARAGSLFKPECGGVFFIGTTARLGDVDSAIRRAGRVDREIELGVPGAADRDLILHKLLRQAGVRVQEQGQVTQLAQGRVSLTVSGVREAASVAHGMVGADLLKVVKEAHLACLRDRLARTTELLLRGQDQGQRDGQRLRQELEQAQEQELDQDLEGEGALALDFGQLSLNNPACTDAAQTAATDTGTGNIIGIDADKDTANTDADTAIAAPTAPTAAVGTRSAITDSALLAAVRRVTPSALREKVVEVPCVRWSDIGGMQEVKQSLREVVEWPLLQPQLFAKAGISPPKGVLLYGPPGCSKTLMAKALATESSMNFLAVRGPELLSKWLGESEKAVQALFRRARAAAPTIIFFDEIDALAGKRGDVSSGVSDRVLSQLLTELDGVHGQGLGGAGHVVVVAATNRPDMLDPALVRPGRIDRKIYVPPPDAQSRAQILRMELRKMPLEPQTLGTSVIPQHPHSEHLQTPQTPQQSEPPQSQPLYPPQTPENPESQRLLELPPGSSPPPVPATSFVFPTTPASSTSFVFPVPSAFPASPTSPTSPVFAAPSLYDDAHLASLTVGFSGAECVAVCAEAAMLAIEEQQEFLSYRHFAAAIRATQPQITPAMLRFYEKCAENL
ncbi:P-loop containing nucleoside triphosphate hydrolase protein [Ochromonadaceae sp. CCMP2298]|nr:P-loop containing nucleoside triphosphate hydrolase protein [Ochromonadaceae sp. CCMP2298]